MHPMTAADRRLAWVDETTQRFDNRVAHWMIKLGHKYSDNLDIIRFAQDYINKKKTLADASRLKCCICQEELYYAGFNSRRGNRHMEAACVTSCGHIIGAMCYEKWHIGCLVRGASFENEDDDEEEGGGMFLVAVI
ncbi:hypothetical protein N0V85_004162 [Neurospora sp. IMI 360204]|nr:hypothetical protein N0V85_004162 [Neurospora sp. IMI 360204]